MDNRLKQDVLLEDALKSQPLAPMPRNITNDVLVRIQKNTRPTIFTWRDFILSSVITLCMAALWFTSQNLPALMLAKLHIQGILLYQNFLVNVRGVLPTSLFGLGAILAALTIPMLYQMMVYRRR